MSKALPLWCKNVKCELIRRDMSTAELARKAKMSRQYTSAVVNGRIYSEPAIRCISDILNIADSPYDSPATTS